MPKIDDLSDDELNNDQLIELEFHVAGVTFDGRQAVLESLSKADRQLIDIELTPDDENAYDANAVEITARVFGGPSPESLHLGRYSTIGYVPKDGARVVRQCLASGRPHAVEIKWFGKPDGHATYGMRINAKFFKKERDRLPIDPAIIDAVFKK